MLTRPACGCLLTLARDAQGTRLYHQRRRRRNLRTDHGYRQDYRCKENGSQSPASANRKTRRTQLDVLPTRWHSVHRACTVTSTQPAGQGCREGRRCSKGQRGPHRTSGSTRSSSHRRGAAAADELEAQCVLPAAGAVRMCEADPRIPLFAVAMVRCIELRISASQLAVAHSCRSTCRSVSEALSEQACISVSRMRWRPADL